VVDHDVTTSDLLALPGACPAPEGSPDAGVPWHYGDPHGEQRLLLSGAGWVDLGHRAVITVSGPDRLGWLHSLTTQHLEQLAPGGSALALVLSPHGHVEHELHLVDDGERTWISTESATAPALLEHLDRMRFLLRVEVRDETPSYAVVAEPVAERHPGLPTYVIPDDFGVETGADPVSARYVPLRPGAFVGREVLVPREDLAAYVAGRPGAGTWAWEALRVAAGVPRAGLDTDHRTIPQEVGWVPTAVHLAKGCYRGQETVARVHNLGRAPRRLTLLHLDGSAPRLPAPGDPVLLEGREVGQVGSVARHHELGPIALALLKRSVPEAEPLVVGPTESPVAAAQETIVTP
jgi:folate-binding protein YgfZ